MPRKKNDPVFNTGTLDAVRALNRALDAVQAKTVALDEVLRCARNVCYASPRPRIYIEDLKKALEELNK